MKQDRKAQGKTWCSKPTKVFRDYPSKWTKFRSRKAALTDASSYTNFESRSSEYFGCCIYKIKKKWFSYFHFNIAVLKAKIIHHNAVSNFELGRSIGSHQWNEGESQDRYYTNFFLSWWFIHGIIIFWWKISASSGVVFNNEYNCMIKYVYKINVYMRARKVSTFFFSLQLYCSLLNRAPGSWLWWIKLIPTLFQGFLYFRCIVFFQWSFRITYLKLFWNIIHFLMLHFLIAKV